MVYLGISMTRSAPASLAWQDRREVASRPQALSSRSSSFSSAGSSESKPSRSTTWQVVQAQDFSQACSISMPCASRMLHNVSPAGASIWMPAGQSAGCGSTVSLGIEARDPLARQRLAHARVHAARGELFRRAVERIARHFDGARIGSAEDFFKVCDLALDVFLFFLIQKRTILKKTPASGIDQALRVDAVLVQDARVHVVLRMLV